jgi:hypothetical protein
VWVCKDGQCVVFQNLRGREVKAARTTRSAKDRVGPPEHRLGSAAASAGPLLAVARDISIASATALPLFEDPSVENRPPNFLPPLPLPLHALRAPFSPLILC